MLLDDKYNQLERLLEHCTIDSEEYKRIQLLMFGYSDEEIDAKMYNYDDPFAEVVERDDYLWDYSDICSGSIMTDVYYELSNKIMIDIYK